MNKNVFWDWRNRPVEQEPSVSSWSPYMKYLPFFLAQPLPIVPEVEKIFYDLRGRGKGGTDQNLSFSIHRKKFPTQGRGNSIGIPKNLYVCHFRCFPCLTRSPLEFLKPTPNLLNLKLLVSLKNLAPPRGGGGGTPIHYVYGYVPPKGVVILKLLI